MSSRAGLLIRYDAEDTSSLGAILLTSPRYLRCGLKHEAYVSRKTCRQSENLNLLHLASWCSEFRSVLTHMSRAEDEADRVWAVLASPSDDAAKSRGVERRRLGR